MMSGAASGSSTMVSTCRSRMPTPRAAMISAGSVLASAVTVLRSTGSIE